MAGAFGWEFILFTVLFYGFFGFVLFILGGWSYLAGQLPGYAQADFGSVSQINFLTQIWIVLTNPLSAVGIISWISTAFFITDIFIIIMDLIP